MHKKLMVEIIEILGVPLLLSTTLVIESKSPLDIVELAVIGIRFSFDCLLHLSLHIVVM